MSARDLERGGSSGPKPRAPGGVAGYPYSTGQYYSAESSERQWTSWLVPMFVVANVAMFVITMFVNNCPKNNFGFQGGCVARFLGRLSFQPLSENPLLGPSSLT
ncbi:hypothetical protein CRG98_038180 [Punica granatum]|nr:hypothetical protein CRG98_038180 [Punica granatum]